MGDLRKQAGSFFFHFSALRLTLLQPFRQLIELNGKSSDLLNGFFFIVQHIAAIADLGRCCAQA
ncbi:hypothetical protein SDC9_179889 [bioreactor metagenome]|uniref:Uncharacterized protein n=1 Tax=bioreactor metagenome TaxID=1076179 RepID=A0A645H033_9ZZZZ